MCIYKCINIYINVYIYIYVICREDTFCIAAARKTIMEMGRETCVSRHNGGPIVALRLTPNITALWYRVV